MNPHSRLSG